MEMGMDPGINRDAGTGAADAAQPDAMCRALLADLGAYLDSEATAEACAAIERHLAQCADCRALVDTLRKTVQLAHNLPHPALTAAARQRLLATLRLDGSA
jgi:anti-sigma factor RsiW